MTYAPSTQTDAAQRLLGDPATPRWLKELDQFLPVKSHFVLHGNIRDLYPVGHDGGAYYLCTVQQLLVDFLALKGFRHFFGVNPLTGMTVLVPSDADPKHAEQTALWVERQLAEGKPSLRAIKFLSEARGKVWRAEGPFDVSVEFAEVMVHNRDAHCAFLFDYLMGQTEQGTTNEKESFVRALIASYEARALAGAFGTYHNPMFWLCDRDNDLPAWFSLNNPRIRSLSLAKPDSKTRSLVIPSLMERVKGFDDLPAEARRKAIEDFSAQTDGMMMNDLEAIARFLPSQRLEPTEVAEAARRYKLGVTEDPWRKITPEHMARAERTIRARVKGQEAAITAALVAIQKAILGMSGAQGTGSSIQPKGKLFFAGPTGVGKTELAKSITEALFGDETAYIRFDMSEFNHEHADQRLIGAPPGYIGFEAGGELTTAIRQRPFSVILFDEIEKAHPRILDKFLQILDDGQLTSGKGERVYFSDALLIFTSNLGVAEASPADEYAELEKKLRAGISDYFENPQKLNRPELLNRLGDNIVVFDFIRPAVAVEILAKMVQNILDRVLGSQGLNFTLSGFPYTGHLEPDTAFAFLAERCTADLRHGGRGIGNVLETWLINPLSLAMWGKNLKPGDRAAVARIRQELTEQGAVRPVVDLVMQ